MAPMNRIDRVSTFKIFLKNLPDGSSQEELRLIFEEYGRVVESEIFRNTFAFIHMEDEDCGKHAISMLNGRNIRGNTVTVEASNQTDLGPKIPCTRICVKNIPDGLKAVELRSLFTKYGLVLAAEISNGTGIVNFEAMGDLRTAINEVNGSVYNGQVLSVEPLVNTADVYSKPVKTPPIQPKNNSAKSSTRPALLQNPQPGTRPMPLMAEPRLLPLLSSAQPSHLLRNPHFRCQIGQGFEGSFESSYGQQMSAEFGNNYDYESDYPLIQSQFDDGSANIWETPVSEGRVLRDPLRDGPRVTALGQSQHRMIRPQWPVTPDQRNLRPLLPYPMQQSVRPPFGPRHSNAPIRNRLPKTNIEPLFLQRKEILNSSQFQNPFNSGNNDAFYEDEEFQQPPSQYQQDQERVPNQNIFNNQSSRPPPLLQQFYDDEPLEHNTPPIYNKYESYDSRPPPPPLFRQPLLPSVRRPPPLFLGSSVKRSVPQVDPGQAFQAPGMIPPGVFQPPRKYFANRQKPPAKKKKRPEPAPQPPIPDQPQRHVPDFSMQSKVPKGSVLRAFPVPPPLMNQNFADDMY